MCIFLPLPATSDMDASDPETIKFNFLGTLVANMGASNDAANLNAPRAMAPSSGGKKSTCPPVEACEDNV